MPPAARRGDMTAHGKPLGPSGGSVNVLIGGQPAWRAFMDFSPCPLTTAAVPHAGGVVVMGSMTVFINNMPAARMGDKIIEAGPPNVISQGMPTVLIGG